MGNSGPWLGAAKLRPQVLPVLFLSMSVYLALSPALSHTHAHTHTHTPPHTQTHTHTHTHTPTHTHTHTHAQTHFLSLTLERAISSNALHILLVLSISRTNTPALSCLLVLSLSISRLLSRSHSPALSRTHNKPIKKPGPASVADYSQVDTLDPSTLERKDDFVGKRCPSHQFVKAG